MSTNLTAIIPCYNDGEYIMEAVDSVLQQSMLPEKIIIVDDGSNQFTKDILKSLNHPMLEIIYQPNQGVSAARNTAIEASRTTFILNLDADDILEPNYIKNALNILTKSNDIGVVGCFYQPFDKRGLVGDVLKPTGGGVVNFLIKNNGSPASIFRKECWEQAGGYDIDFIDGYEDWDFWISLLSKEWKMEILPSVFLKYRIKPISRDQTALAKYDRELRIAILEKHWELYKQNFKSFSKQLILQNSTLRLTILKRENSQDFRLGSILLKPLRFLKNKF